MYAVLYLVGDKAVVVLVTIHVYNERGTRSDGQKSVN